MPVSDFRHNAWNKLDMKWGTVAINAFVYSIIISAPSFLISMGMNSLANYLTAIIQQLQYNATISLELMEIYLSYMVNALVMIGHGILIVFILSAPLTLGFCIMALRVVRKQQIGNNVIISGFKDFTRIFILYLTNAIFIMLWFLLFIIPGIVKAMSYSMSYYIMIDNPNISASEARKRSMEYMEGRKGQLFCLYLSFIGWVLLTALTLGILSYWIMPYMQTAEAEFYQNILDERGIKYVNSAPELPQSNEHKNNVQDVISSLDQQKARLTSLYENGIITKEQLDEELSKLIHY